METAIQSLTVSLSAALFFLESAHVMAWGERHGPSVARPLSACAFDIPCGIINSSHTLSCHLAPSSLHPPSRCPTPLLPILCCLSQRKKEQQRKKNLDAATIADIDGGFFQKRVAKAKGKKPN